MKYGWWLLVLSIAIAVCSSCNSSPTPTEVSAAEPPGPAPANVAVPVAGPASEFAASGPIIVENQVDVAAQREGVVAQILVDTGTAVKKGQLLVLLDDRQVTADLDAARAKTRSTEADLRNWQAEAKVLEADYARAQKMWEAQLITKEQLEHAMYKAESDQWDVKRVQELLTNAQQTERSLELELEKTRVRAPFDGVVARRYIRVGETITRDERLFWVTAVAPLRIRITLPEKFLGRVKPGATVTVTLSEAPQTKYTARIVQVSPVVDFSSDTIEVLAELKGLTPGLRPGMRANLLVPNVP